MRVCVIVVIAVFVLSIAWKGSSTPFSLSDLGYSSAYQGPKAKFLGITYNNIIYTGTNFHGASQHVFDTVMHFDSDGAASGMPKIRGEMTAIFLPKESLTFAPDWIPFGWLQNNGLVSNPVVGADGVNPPYTWNISGNTYLMEEYAMRYYISLSAEWSGSEMPLLSGTEALGGYVKANAYKNVGVWINFDISPSWYIQGGGTAYFAIAELRLAENVQMQGHDANGQKYDARTLESVSPESRQSIVYLYYSKFGAFASSGDPMQYEGKDLNPAYFTSDLYAHVDLNNFGVATQPVNYYGRLEKGDIATFAFDIRVFVIGEYKVQDIQTNPDQYGRYVPVDTTGNNWLTGIVGWLSQPSNVALLIIILVIAAIVIFAPWLLLAIIPIFTGGRKNG